MDLQPIRADFLRAALAGRRLDAARLVCQALNAGVDADALLVGVLGEAQREVGDRWAENVISVADEHLTTATTQLTAALLLARAERPAPQGLRALFACVPGERHGVPCQLAAATYELAGFDVIYLGADVPQVELLRAVDVHRPHLVGLSCTLFHHLPALHRSLDALASAHPDVLRAAGGQAIDPSFRPRHPCVRTGDAARPAEAARALRSLQADAPLAALR